MACLQNLVPEYAVHPTHSNCNTRSIGRIGDTNKKTKTMWLMDHAIRKLQNWQLARAYNKFK